MTKTHGLYIMTGKGGVGKSSLSLALASHLKELGKKPLIISFEANHYKHVQDLGIPIEHLDLLTSAETYITHKLHSSTLAHWIVSTTFFKAVLNMVPGFNYVIFMGHVVDRLIKDPKLTVILDSPSSGHTLTMFESLYNFKDIFQTGLLAQDLQKLTEYLEDPQNLKINVVSFPSAMAIHEAIELKEKLLAFRKFQVNLHLNNSLGMILDTDVLPELLAKKMEMERAVLSEYKKDITSSLPYSTSLEYPQLIRDLSSHVAALL